MAEIKAAENGHEIERGNKKVDKLHSGPGILAVLSYCLPQRRCSPPAQLQAIENPRCPNYGKQMVDFPVSALKELKLAGIFSGGCQCGAIRFHVEGALGRAGICHCRMCQKAFGSWGAALVSVPASNLSWTRGKPSVFKSSAIVARGLCSRCGTPLYMREDGDANFELAIGAFDEPQASAPSRNRRAWKAGYLGSGSCIFCRNKPPTRRALARISPS